MKFLQTLEGRLGSPIPRWHRPEDNAQETPAGNKPGIQITPCEDKLPWSNELRSDPLYKDNPRLQTAVKGDVAKNEKKYLPKKYAPLKPITSKSEN